MNLLDATRLGKPTEYSFTYEPKLLHALPRKDLRQQLGVSQTLPFRGKDIWNAYELSWLNLQGKPEVAIAEFIIEADSVNLIESKSFKLYLNSFNATRFADLSTVKALLQKDLMTAVKGNVEVNLYDCHQPIAEEQFAGIFLDDLNVEIDQYHYSPAFLTTTKDVVNETVFTHLFRSICPVTGQPDWASVRIHYHGPQIVHEGLLKYLISYRHHAEFHEQCVERIFMDILQSCLPTQLAVSARFTRRGGLDINPYRSNFAYELKNKKAFRQ